MCWMCDDPTMTRADADARMAGLVERYGWAVQYVEGSRMHPPWAYTVGLTLHGAPELVVTGLPAGPATEFLNDQAHVVVHHEERLAAGDRFALEGGRQVEVVALPHPDAHLLTAARLYGTWGLAALQLVWADDRGRWPWSRGFRGGHRGGQPVLGPRRG